MNPCITAYRITPAGAGKTQAMQYRPSGTSDHPRRCGENTPRGDAAFARAGSPPQVRGKHPASLPSSLQTRITPAGAGKTNVCNNTRRRAQDHPRRCGENRQVLILRTDDIGSPPQVRGKHCIQNSKASRFGITPAGAGKTAKEDLYRV